MMLATAVPWVFPGATVACMLASVVGREVRQPTPEQRLHDAKIFALGLGIAAACAQLIQAALNQWGAGLMIQIAHAVGTDVVTQTEPAASGSHISPFTLVPVLAVVGTVCGAVIGYLVPPAGRENLMTPPDWTMARALQDLRVRATSVLGDEAAAEAWVLKQRDDLGGITPAEAVQYQGLATSVWRLLDVDAPPGSTGDAGPDSSGAGPRPVVILGGRAG